MDHLAIYVLGHNMHCFSTATRGFKLYPTAQFEKPFLSFEKRQASPTITTGPSWISQLRSDRGRNSKSHRSVKRKCEKLYRGDTKSSAPNRQSPTQEMTTVSAVSVTNSISVPDFIANCKNMIFKRKLRFISRHHQSYLHSCQQS